MFVTKNIRIPNSLYHLPSTQIKNILVALKEQPITKGDLATLIEVETGSSRRIAKELAKRVDEGELKELHKGLADAVNCEGVKETLISYESSRGFATVTLES